MEGWRGRKRVSEAEKEREREKEKKVLSSLSFPKEERVLFELRK